MKILLLISGRQVPSSRFRVLQYVPYLRALGHDCRIAASFPPKYEHVRWLGWRGSNWLRRGMRAIDSLRAAGGRYDVALLERELFHDSSVWGERLLRKMSRRLVFDIDDAVFQNSPKKFERFVPLCDRVIAGNSLLAQWAESLNPQTVVIPTCVDLRRYPVRPKSESTPVIGWIGTSSNLQYLAIVAPALRKLAAERKFELHVVSDRPASVADLPLEGVTVRAVPWSEQAEIDHLSRFDVGLMPLADDEWTRYKCGLKAIQYLAIGIPAVVSPVGVNCQIVRSGEEGFQAASSDEWHDALAKLLDDPQLRARLGAAGRVTVAERYSIESQLPRFVAALE